MSVFPTEEYENRVRNVQSEMRSHDIDVLLATDPAHMHYLTEYDAWSFYVPQMVIMALEADEPIWLGRKLDANAARETTWLSEESIVGYQDEYVWPETETTPMDFVGDFLTELGYVDATIGLEMAAYYFTARDYRRLRQRLPEVSFEDATRVVDVVRAIKSDREQDQMRRASRITDEMIEVARATMEPGVREFEVIAKIYAAMISGVDDYGGDYCSSPPMMPTGTGTNTAHLTWSNERLSVDQPVILETSGVSNRYHAPLARTMYLGTPPEEFERLATAAEEGLDAALDTARAGVTSHEVHHAYRAIVNEYGFDKESRLAYSVGGAAYPPTWGEGYGERTYVFAPDDDTVLKENTTFHVVSGLWTDEYGVELSETVRITDSGVEILSDLPHELVTI